MFYRFYFANNTGRLSDFFNNFKKVEFVTGVLATFVEGTSSILFYQNSNRQDSKPNFWPK
jgi:hypothetical protein